MSAVLMRLRADIRERVLGVVGVALLVGLAGAVVLAAAAGARRTSSTPSRVYRASHAADVLVNPDHTPDAESWKAVDGLPEVAASAQLVGVFGARLDGDGQLDVAFVYNAVIGANPDGRLFREIYIFPQRPNDVLSYDHLAGTPLLLVAVLGLLAIGSTIHLLVTSVRSRRRDVALLKTIGLSRGQALSAVLVQASALILLALAVAVAVPVGALAGRWLWVETARWLGIADDLPLPLLPLGVITIAALAGAATIAAGPGVLAARVQIATALRSE